MTVMEWNSNQSYNQTKVIPVDGLFRGVGSKEITWTYTGNGYQPILKVAPNQSPYPYQDFARTATVENLVIDGQNEPYTTGILLEDVYNCQIRNVTIKNCAMGIMLRAATANRYSEANSIRHVRMTNVGKGIVFDKGSGTGSFAFTTIDDVGISLKDNSSSVGISIGNGTADVGCQPYNSIIRATVWMGPNNPGTGMLIEGGNYPGELKGGLGNLSVYNRGGSVAGYGIDFSNKDYVIEKTNSEFLLAYHNVNPFKDRPQNDHNEVIEKSY